MFRVPSDERHPSYDATVKVSFWRWLTSNKYERLEWQRRRRAAAALAAHNQRQRLRDYAQGDTGNDGNDGAGVATNWPW